tara:strand:- start:49 stop:465 length:417 start_codon:yes stop_codon:yes gene_type:complete
VEEEISELFVRHRSVLSLIPCEAPLRARSRQFGIEWRISDNDAYPFGKQIVFLSLEEATVMNGMTVEDRKQIDARPYVFGFKSIAESQTKAEGCKLDRALIQIDAMNMLKQPSKILVIRTFPMVSVPPVENQPLKGFD